jgi:hypothetical protein
MGKRMTRLFYTLLLAGVFTCCGGGSGATAGGSSGSGASSGGSSGGATSSGGSGGGTTGSVATSCAIADAGSFNSGAADPENICQVCDPTRSATDWSSGQACTLCHDADGGAGICGELGACCTTICDNGMCRGIQGSSCATNSDCCGIPINTCT